MTLVCSIPGPLPPPMRQANKMARALRGGVFLLLVWLAVSSAMATETRIHLGTVNGQRVGSNEIEVSRLLDDPVLWQRPAEGDDVSATRLVLANAQWQPGGGGITVTQSVWDSRGQEHQVTVILPLVLLAGERRAEPVVQQVGHELHLALPAGPVQLRTEGPLRLRTDKGFRGPLRMVLTMTAWP